jgi:alkyl hydroperoxide reductase subunit AhpF
MGIPSINVGEARTDAGGEVTLLIFSDGSSISSQLVGFAKYFAQAHPNVKVDVQDWMGGKNERMKSLHIEYAPCMVLTKGDFSRIRYYGVPDGYEIAPLSDAIAELSASNPKLSPSSLSALTNVRRRANIKVFILTTCTFCPIVARHAMRAAIASKTITSEIIDSSVFTDLSQKHLVQGVPKVVLNDITDMTGAVNETTFIEKLRDADHALIDSMFG